MLCILLIGIPNPEIFYKRTDLKKTHFFFISFAVRFFWHKTIALNCKTDNKYGILKSLTKSSFRHRLEYKTVNYIWFAP